NQSTCPRALCRENFRAPANTQWACLRQTRGARKASQWSDSIAARRASFHLATRRVRAAARAKAARRAANTERVRADSRAQKKEYVPREAVCTRWQAWATKQT